MRLTADWATYCPSYEPFISPVRGNVVHYSPRQTKSPKTEELSPWGYDSTFSFWLRYAEKDYDYLIQRKQGDVVVGRANTGRRATGDDSATDLSPMAHLRGVADEVAALPAPTASAHVDHVWSGILAFTQDTSPFIGRLPFRSRSHQWVCGAYHGIGMTKAFRTAEMMALLLLDEKVPDEYPRSMLLTLDPLRSLRKSLGYVEEEENAAKAKL